jgi:anti-sigma factor (TIGR02949 family)
MEKTHSCKYFRLQVDEYIEGELTDAEMREFEAHIAECDDCRREVESARRLYAILRSSREPAPDGLHSRIMKAVKAEGRSKKKALIFRRSALSASCQTSAATALSKAACSTASMQSA